MKQGSPSSAPNNGRAQIKFFIKHTWLGIAPISTEGVDPHCSTALDEIQLSKKCPCRPPYTIVLIVEEAFVVEYTESCVCGQIVMGFYPKQSSKMAQCMLQCLHMC